MKYVAKLSIIRDGTSITGIYFLKDGILTTSVDKSAKFDNLASLLLCLARYRRQNHHYIVRVDVCGVVKTTKITPLKNERDHADAWVVEVHTHDKNYYWSRDGTHSHLEDNENPPKVFGSLSNLSVELPVIFAKYPTLKIVPVKVTNNWTIESGVEL